MSALGRRPSRRLSFEDAVTIWFRHWEGEFQNRIAAHFDVNPGRVNEVLKQHLHPDSHEEAIRRSGGAGGLA